MHFGFERSQFGQNPSQSQRLFAKRRPQPVVPGGSSIAFIENQVDDRKHRRQPRREFSATGNFKGNLRLGEGSFGAHDALCDRGFRHEIGPRNFVRRQAAEQTQSKRNLRFSRKHGMAGDEYQAEQVIADIVVESSVEFVHRGLTCPNFARTDLLNDAFATEFFVLAVKPLVAAEVVDGAIFGSGHQPGARIIGNARLRPLFQGGHQSILSQVFGHTDIAHNSGQTGDEPRRLDPPDCVDGSMCIGSCHSHRSHHL